MYRELEASLSCRQDRGEPVSVRCIFRDVTAQYQRERRLAMQLAVSQVVGESTTSDEALPAMLESLGTNLGFDMAGLWFVSSDHHTPLPGRLVRSGPGVHRISPRQHRTGAAEGQRPAWPDLGGGESLLDRRPAARQQLSARRLRLRPTG